MTPSNPALEDAIRREPTNPDVIAVYADWLRYDKADHEVTARGNVRLEQRNDVLEGSEIINNAGLSVPAIQAIFEHNQFTLPGTTTFVAGRFTIL